jgi:segregation and condensation protein A
MQNFAIKIDKFEGPLDLLLEMVEKKKLHITEVSLASVADEFINHIKSYQEMPMAQTADFIVIASTLLLIKSKALLPYLDLSKEDEGNIEELEIRLKVYKLIRDASKEIENLYGKKVIYPLNPPPREIRFAPGTALSLSGIHEAVSSVLNNLPKQDRRPQTQVKTVISLEEMIERLEKKIKSAVSMTFKEFAQNSKWDAGMPVEEIRAKKVEIVVSFLALLELVKQGIMGVKQESRFGDILMETQDVSTPKYGDW